MKYRKANKAVSAVIGVILMVAITVAISATVYVYATGMIGDMSATSVIPSMQFMRQSDDLIVYQCDSNVNWSDLTVNGTTDTLPTGIMSAGQRIENCVGVITIAYDGQLIGTWDI